MEMDGDAESADVIDEDNNQLASSEIQSVTSESLFEKMKVKFTESCYECEGGLKELDYEVKMNAELIKQNDEPNEAHNTFLSNLKENAVTNT